MQSNRLGIQLSKAEVAALIEFTASPDDAPEHSGVRFVVTEKTVRAYATDGARAVEAIGQTEHEGEVEEIGPSDLGQWDVQGGFLRSAARLLEGKQALRIAFAGGKLDSVYVEEEGKEISRYSGEEDVVSAQLTLPDVEKLLSTLVLERSGTEFGAPRVRYTAAYLASLEKVAKAADTNFVMMHASPSEDKATFFTCEALERATKWTVVVMPARDIGGTELDRPEPSKPPDPLKLEPAPRPKGTSRRRSARDGVREAAENLRNTLKENNATLEVLPGGNAKASKKPAKAAKSKKKGRRS